MFLYSHVVVSECEVNMCQNNGTCMKHVLTYTCDCPSGFIGAFCQEKGVLCDDKLGR